VCRLLFCLSFVFEKGFFYDFGSSPITSPVGGLFVLSLSLRFCVYKMAVHSMLICPRGLSRLLVVVCRGRFG